MIKMMLKGDALDDAPRIEKRSDRSQSITNLDCLRGTPFTFV